jgi:hypothetical protein
LKLSSSVPRAVLVAALAAITGCGTVLPDNHAPVIRQFYVNGVAAFNADGSPAGAKTPDGVPLFQISKGSDVLVQVDVDDSDRDALTVTWSSGVTAISNSSGTDDQPKKSGTFKASAEGMQTVSCSVSDGRGGIATKSVTLDVVNAPVNHAPSATLAPAQATLKASTGQAFTVTAADVDSDTLTYSYFADRGKVVQDQATPTKATYTAPASAGADNVYAVVSDGKGGYTVAASKITVTP